MSSNPERREWPRIMLGVFLLLGLHILVALTMTLISFILLSLVDLPVIGSWLSIIASFSVVAIGIVQLLYVIPTVLWLRKKRQWSLMKGVIIGAVITALLNGGCYLLVFIAMR